MTNMPRSSTTDLLKSPASPRRRKLSSMGKHHPVARQLLKELQQQEQMEPPRSTSKNALSTSSLLGKDSLERIHRHALSIAEMRPNRRKVKWQNVAFVQDPRQEQEEQTMKRIQVGLELKDLSLHGLSSPRAKLTKTVEAVEHSSPQSAKKTMKGLTTRDMKATSSKNKNIVKAVTPLSHTKCPEEEIDALELQIERIHKMIARLGEETNELNQRASALKEENKGLRHEIFHTIPNSHSSNSSKQGSLQQLASAAQKLREFVAETNQQISLLDEQTSAIRASSQPCRSVLTPKSNRPRSVRDANEKRNGEWKSEKEEKKEEEEGPKEKKGLNPFNANQGVLRKTVKKNAPRRQKTATKQPTAVESPLPIKSGGSIPAAA